MGNPYINIEEQKRQMIEDGKKLKAAKTKEDLNKIFNGRIIVVQNNTDWNGERCEFVEMVGEGGRQNWKMKVKTRFGTFLELCAGEGMIVTQTIATTQAEAEKIRRSLSGE